MVCQNPMIVVQPAGLSKKNEGSEGPHSLHGPLELSSTGQKIGVNEITGSQREPSLVVSTFFVNTSVIY